jgi:hypothetical protein
LTGEGHKGHNRANRANPTSYEGIEHCKRSSLSSRHLQRSKLNSNLREILRHKALSVVTMRRAVVPDQIMRQLMAKDHPPIHNSVSTVGGGTLEQGLLLQLLEIEIVAEDTACPVKGDCLATWVVEDAEAISSHRED